MPRKKFKSLRAKTAIIVLVAMIIGIAVYYLTNSIGGLIITNVYCSEERSNERVERYAESFKSYVSDNDLNSSSYQEIKSWCKSQKYLYLSIYDKDLLKYETDGTYGEIYNQSGYTEYLDESNSFQVSFSDGVQWVSIIEFTESPYYSLLSYMSLGFGVVVAFLIIMSFNWRFIRRSIHLSEEVREVCFGDINREIKIKGDDEISELGSDVNEMRMSIISHYEKEQKALDANTELLTSISHDIRTPLTSLIGYSDMITDSSITDIDEIKKYASVCRDKAYQLKNMTDTLFRYFLVYGNQPVNLDVREYSADSLLEQLIGEYIAEARQKSFDIETDIIKAECRIKTDVNMLKRVFDNVFSNIEKYADVSKRISVLVSEQGKVILIQITNSISRASSNPESTKIGLKTCEKIMEKLGGKFVYSNDKKNFTVNIIIPKVVN